MNKYTIVILIILFITPILGAKTIDPSQGLILSNDYVCLHR